MRVQQRRTRDASRQIFQEIERRVIGPMNVFDDEQRRHTPRGGENSGKETLTRRLRIDVEIGRDVVQWSERSWCEQRLASGAQNAHAIGDLSRELVE